MKITVPCNMWHEGTLGHAGNVVHTLSHSTLNWVVRQVINWVGWRHLNENIHYDIWNHFNGRNSEGYNTNNTYIHLSFSHIVFTLRLCMVFRNVSLCIQ